MISPYFIFYITLKCPEVRCVSSVDILTEKLQRRDAQLASLLAYIRDTQSPRLQGYHGTDVDLILRLLRQPLPPSTAVYNLFTANDRAARRTSEFAIDASSSTPPRDWQHLEHDEHDIMHEIAHGLHFASIAMLGFLVLEVIVVLPCNI